MGGGGGGYDDDCSHRTRRVSGAQAGSSTRGGRGRGRGGRLGGGQKRGRRGGGTAYTPYRPPLFRRQLYFSQTLRHDVAGFTAKLDLISGINAISFGGEFDVTK